MTQWFWTRSGQEQEPVDSKQLKKLARDGQILPEDTVWREGMADWVKASGIKGLFPEPVPPPSPKPVMVAEAPFLNAGRPLEAYVPSRAAPLLGLLMILLLAPIAAAICGLVYGIVCFYNPFIYVNFMGSIMIAMLGGYCLVRIARIGKVRNGVILACMGLAIGVVVLYGNWVAWRWAIGGQWVFHAGDLWQDMVKVSHKGYWGFAMSVTDSSGRNVSGGALWTFWIIEALILVFGAAVMAIGGFMDLVLCEGCNKWATKEVLPPFNVNSEFRNHLADFDKGDFRALQTLRQSPPEICLTTHVKRLKKDVDQEPLNAFLESNPIGHFFEITIWHCPQGCLEIMSITEVCETVAKDSTVTKTEKILVEQCNLPIGTRDFLKTLPVEAPQKQETEETPLPACGE